MLRCTVMKLLVVVALAACGGKSDVPGAGSSTKGSASPADGVSQSSPIEGDPAYAVVERAFRDKRPAFPLLSKDGNVAAVEIVTPIGQSGGSTYSVAFITPGADAWSGSDEPITLVDAKLVHLLLDSGDTAAVAKYDIDTITKAARGISDRILEGGFRRFDTSFDAIGVGDLVAAGPFRFKVTEETSAITIAISEGTRQIAVEQIQPVPMGRVGDIDCLAMPVVKRAFSDAGRRRLLLHVGWKTGPDQCDAPDDRYRLVAAP